VHSEVIIPLPEAEQYRLGVQRKRREAEREQEQKARAGRLLPRLVEAGALENADQMVWGGFRDLPKWRTRSARPPGVQRAGTAPGSGPDALAATSSFVRR
jgi:hypothetical protein